MNIRISFLSIVALLTLFSHSPAATLFDLTTAATSGGSQNLFAASATAGGSGLGSFSGTLPGNLIFTSGTTAGNDYFVGKFSSHTLTSVGDTLTLGFTVTTTNFPSATPQVFRFGLFNTTGTTGSGSPGSNSYNLASGYRVDYGTANAANGIRERTGAALNLYTTSSTPLVGSQTSSNFTFSPASGSTYTGSFAVQLMTGGQVQITSQINGLSPASVSVLDTASAFTSYNTFSFFAPSASGNAATFNFGNLSVSTSTVPEPSGGLFLLLGGSLLTLINRRRLA